MAIQIAYAATIPCTEFRFTGTDGLRVAYSRWEAQDPARGVVQIAHGRTSARSLGFVFV
jgi:alpha-beta hydrolase superfamily lysophospholipase